MATVMGIDPSLTSTGWVVLKDGELLKHGAIQTKLTGMERLVFIDNQLHEVLNAANPDLVYIEGYSFGSQGRSVYQIGELGGVIRLMLHFEKTNIGRPDWAEIPPKNLKKFVTGKGNADKTAVALAAYKKWGVEFPTSDETDAYVLAKMAEEAVT